MSFPEIIFRMKEEIRKNYEKFLLKDLSPNIIIEKKTLKWFCEKQEQHEISSFLRENQLWDQEIAQDILNHKFSFFAFDKKSLGKKR